MKKLAAITIAFLLGLAVGAFMAISLTGRSLEASRQTPSPAVATTSAGYLGSPVASSTTGKFADPAYRRRLSGTARPIPGFNRIMEVRAKGLIESVAGGGAERTILFQVAEVKGFQTLNPGGQGPANTPPIAAGGTLKARVSPAITATIDRGRYDAIFRFAGPGASEPPIAIKLERLGQ